MSQQSVVPPGSHPVLRCADVLESALKDVGDVDPAFMATEDKLAAVLRLARVEAMLKELQLRVRASSDDVAEHDGARDPAEWTAHHARQDRGLARREQRLAEGLAERWHLVAAAMREGTVNPPQAHAITHALDVLPGGLDPAVVTSAEQRLVAEAEHFGPRELTIMGRRILDVVAPELGEEQERKALEAEERHADKKTHLDGRRLGDGSTDVRGNLPDPVWDRLVTYLEAYTSPRRPGQEPDNPDDRRPYEMRLGSAMPPPSW